MLSRFFSVYMDMTFLGRKFLSILRASIIVEMVSFIVTMTDTLVAGNPARVVRRITEADRAKYAWAPQDMLGRQ